MDITAFGLATKAGKELREIKKDIGDNVEGSYATVKERLDKIEGYIESGYALANKAIVNNAINIAKAEGRLNALTMSIENNFSMTVFDELYNLDGIDTMQSKFINHEPSVGYIESTHNSCEVYTKEINVGLDAKKLIVTNGDEQNKPYVRFKGRGGFNFGKLTQYNINSEITMEAIFRIQEINSGLGHVFCNLENKGWCIFFQSGKVGLYLHIGSSYITIKSSKTFNKGDLVHAAVTYDKQTVRLYVNGVLENSYGRVGTITSPGESLVFGYNPPDSTNEAKDFDLYEARVFSKFRTIEEINENKNILKNKEGLVLHVKPVVGGMKDLSSYGVIPTMTTNFTGDMPDSTTNVNQYKGRIFISFNGVDWHEKESEKLIDIEKINTTGKVRVKMLVSEKALLSYYAVAWD